MKFHEMISENELEDAYGWLRYPGSCITESLHDLELSFFSTDVFLDVATTGLITDGSRDDHKVILNCSKNGTTPVLAKRYKICDAPPPTEKAVSLETHGNGELVDSAKWQSGNSDSAKWQSENIELVDSAKWKLERSELIDSANWQSERSEQNVNVESDGSHGWGKRQLECCSDSQRSTKKRGVPHDRTPVDLFIQAAKSVNNYDATGLADNYKFVVIHEEIFFNYVSTHLKDSKYNLKKTSFFEKFDKSRPSNRVNPKSKSRTIPIKYLRIDKMNKLTCEFYDQIQKDMEEVEAKHGVTNIRVITRRDWGYIPQRYFVYEPKQKK